MAQRWQGGVLDERDEVGRQTKGTNETVEVRERLTRARVLQKGGPCAGDTPDSIFKGSLVARDLDFVQAASYLSRDACESR